MSQKTVAFCWLGSLTRESRVAHSGIALNPHTKQDITTLDSEDLVDFVDIRDHKTNEKKLERETISKIDQAGPFDRSRHKLLLFLFAKAFIALKMYAEGGEANTSPATEPANMPSPT